MQIIELLHEKTELSKLFNTNVPFDYENLVVLGYSFGGATAQHAAYNDNRIKATILLDPCKDYYN
jgi:hypothetical protein